MSGHIRHRRRHHHQHHHLLPDQVYGEERDVDTPADMNRSFEDEDELLVSSPRSSSLALSEIDSIEDFRDEEEEEVSTAAEEAKNDDDPKQVRRMTNKTGLSRPRRSATANDDSYGKEMKKLLRSLEIMERKNSAAVNRAVTRKRSSNNGMMRIHPDAQLRLLMRSGGMAQVKPGFFCQLNDDDAVPSNKNSLKSPLVGGGGMVMPLRRAPARVTFQARNRRINRPQNRQQPLTSGRQ